MQENDIQHQKHIIELGDKISNNSVQVWTMQLALDLELDINVQESTMGGTIRNLKETPYELPN